MIAHFKKMQKLGKYFFSSTNPYDLIVVGGGPGFIIVC